MPSVQDAIAGNMAHTGTSSSTVSLDVLLYIGQPVGGHLQCEAAVTVLISSIAGLLPTCALHA
jgi:hypothetical protein